MIFQASWPANRALTNVRDLILAENLKLYGWERACDVADTAGAVFEGREHDALADACGIAAGFIARIREKAPNPFLPEGAIP